MHIRAARESEAPGLSALSSESKAFWGYSSEQLAIWAGETAISPMLISTYPTYVAELDEEIAGFFLLIPSLPHWKLEHFWVSPARMRRGIGKALLAYAADLAARGGVTALSIDADPNAEQFYLACGAQRVNSIPAPIKGFLNRERPQLLLSTG